MPAKSLHIYSQRQSGNVLWFVLIGVVLLAALTLLLTRSGSTVDQSGDVEQLRIKESQLIRYGKSLETAVQQLLLNGCSENDISFENPLSADDYTNAGSPPDKRCHVFEPEGTGLTWQSLGEDAIPGSVDNTVIANDGKFSGLGTDSGAAGTDLILLVYTTSELCSQINKDLGISGDISSGVDTFESYADGKFWDNWIIGLALGGPALEGKNSGCFLDDHGFPIFYYVVLAR